MKFTVSHGKIRLFVRVLPTVQDVHKAYHDGVDKRTGDCVYSFFDAPSARSRYTGTLCFAEGTRLYELVPHEVFHAVAHHYQLFPEGGTPRTDNEEVVAKAVGILSARVLDKIENDHRPE